MLAGFPVGPYSLATKFVAYRLAGALLAAATALACIIGYGYMAKNQAAGILHDERVWNAGGPEIPASIDGRVTTRQFVLKSYDLTVQFVTPDGTLRNKNLELTTLFGGIAEEREPTVRLMPGSVDDFALSLAVDVAKTRWAAAAFFVVIGILLLGGAFAGIVYAIARQSRRILRAARTGTPQACELISREPILYQGSPTGTDIFKFKVVSAVAGAPPTEVKYQLRTKGSDVVQLASGKAVLALVPAGAPDKAILVLRDYYPLGLSDSERMQADAAVASGQR